MRRCGGPSPGRARREGNCNGQCKRAFATLIHLRPPVFFFTTPTWHRRERIAVVKSVCKSHPAVTQDLERTADKRTRKRPPGCRHITDCSPGKPATPSSSPLRFLALCPAQRQSVFCARKISGLGPGASCVPDHILRHPSFQLRRRRTAPSMCAPAEPRNALTDAAVKTCASRSRGAP